MHSWKEHKQFSGWAHTAWDKSKLLEVALSFIGKAILFVQSTEANNSFNLRIR